MDYYSLPTSEGWWMAELAKGCSMQPYIILYKTTLQLGVRNVPKVFTWQWPGRESNRVSTIRLSDALPVSHRATLPCRGLGLVRLALNLVDWPTIVLQCFDTVGWVIWPVKIVPDMTYNVFGGTLNPTLLYSRPLKCWTQSATAEFLLLDSVLLQLTWLDD